MEGELPEASDRRLNRAVAITVVILSVATAMGKIKDDNIVQTMQAATAEKIDYWNEYQADRLKLHVSQMNPDKAAAAADVKHYESESKDVKAKALAAQDDYDKAGYRDDQFDLSDGFASIALGVTAVSALVESWGLLIFGWASGSLALLFITAGFAQLPVHPDLLVAWLS